jgi:hypothetical protein
MKMYEDRGRYGQNMLYMAHNEMLKDKTIVFGCPFNLSLNMFIRRDGHGYSTPLWPDSEVDMVTFLNPFPPEVLFHESYYIFQMMIPTPFIHPQVFTEPAYHIYFPSKNLCFNGYEYQTPDKVPEPLVIQDKREYYRERLEAI